MKKVTSSHAKGRVELLAEEPPDEEKLRAVLAGAGYTVTAVRTEPWEKKGFPFFRT